MRTKFRVTVKSSPWIWDRCWRAKCPSCYWMSLPYAVGCLPLAHEQATRHAATCEALHRANWAAACPSCKAYGHVAPACPICLGYGFEHEQEGLS